MTRKPYSTYCLVDILSQIHALSTFLSSFLSLSHTNSMTPKRSHSFCLIDILWQSHAHSSSPTFSDTHSDIKALPLFLSHRCSITNPRLLFLSLFFPPLSFIHTLWHQALPFFFLSETFYNKPPGVFPFSPYFSLTHSLTPKLYLLFLTLVDILKQTNVKHVSNLILILFFCYRNP